jgi:hypothetical protein
MHNNVNFSEIWSTKGREGEHKFSKIPVGLEKLL